MSEGKETFIKEETASGGVEKAIVAQMGADSGNVENNPELLSAIAEVGLTPDKFRKLVSEDFEDAREPYDETLQLNGITEEVHVRIAQIGGKQIEVAHCRRKEDSKESPSESDLQLRQNGSFYKIVFGLAGEGVLRLPKTTYPAGHLYVATTEADYVPFKKGTIAIIRAPTAWAFESSKSGLEYLYVSNPPYTSSLDTSAEKL